MIPPHRIWTMMKSGAAAAVTTYLLNFPWNTADVGFTDAQVLNTKLEGQNADGDAGTGTVVEVDGTLAISSNALAFTAQSTPTWGDLGIHWDGQTKVIGLGLLTDFSLSTWEEMGFGWHGAAAVVDPDSAKFAIQANTTDGQLDNDSGTNILTGLSTSTTYKLALVLGGFNTNGTPFYTGQTKANYKFGSWYFYYDASNWHLLWVETTDNTGTLYPMFSSLDAVGTLDNTKAPDPTSSGGDLSGVMEKITNFSSFTAANGTSLDAITPEVGGGWTEQNGDFDIQSNRAHTTGAAPANPRFIATQDTGVADHIVKTIIQLNGAPNNGFIVTRYGAGGEFYMCGINEATDAMEMFEWNGSGFTARGSNAVTFDPATDYDVVLVSDGASLTLYADGANRLNYGSATVEQAATVVGARAFDNDMEFDNYSVFPRTHADYDTILNSV